MSSNGHPIARLLPPEEWSRLTDPYLASLPPDAANVVVVEVNGQIVAQWAAMQVVHVEGLWVDPAYQGHAGVGRSLLSLMVQTLRDLGVQEALTQAATPEIAEMCQRVGGREVPGTTWVIPVQDPQGT